MVIALIKVDVRYKRGRLAVKHDIEALLEYMAILSWNYGILVNTPRVQFVGNI